MSGTAIQAASLSTSWLGFLASPAAPRRAMSVLELDGYLTGIVVAPTRIRPSLWVVGLWGEEEAFPDDTAQIQSVLGDVGTMLNALSADIDRSLHRLETERVCDYRPAFHRTDDKPAHATVRTWMRGFVRAMELAPSDWLGLGADERMQVLLAPFVGFMDIHDEEFEPAEDIDARLDQAATLIPRFILLLRKIAQFRVSRSETRRDKIGRNDPCPCGSDKKFKRCCGAC
jgi:uncharacterized protein